MSKSKKSKGDDFKQEDILQAVLIADSFNVRFAPITQLKPRALLPLVNVPLIEYTLECLFTSGIEQVILFCCIHADLIKQYIDSSRWSRTSCPMEIMLLVSEGCTSVGDALREIDAKSLIATDFVLINGDMISNVQLKPLLESHKQRRIKEKTPIMTMLCKKAPPDHTTRCREEDVIMAIEKQGDRVISYEKVANSRKFDFPLDLFEGRSEVSLRFDLLDTHISICSPIVPTLFTDNFDYLTRDDFIKGILDNEEILGNTIHMHLLEDEYAARVSNLFMYESVSKDVLSRWSYPLVPDKNISEHSDDKYSMGRHNIYLHSDVTLARGCILEENVVIGKGSSIGSNTKILDSVIGKNVKIGENVNINGAFIWDNCCIEDNCNLYKCILDTNVHVKQKVTVKSGCVLAQKVIVGPCLVLDKGTCLIASVAEDDFGDGDNQVEEDIVDTSLVGNEGVGYRYEAEVDSDDEVEELTSDVWGYAIQSDGESIDSEESCEDEEGLEGEDANVGEDGEVATMEEGEEEDEQDEDSKMFSDEVISTLERGIADDIDTDNLILEINSAKSAYGIYIKEVNLVITNAILELPLKQNPGLELAQYFPLLRKNFKKCLAVLQNYIKSAESQNDCLTAIEDCCTCNPVVSKSLFKILHFLYEKDILAEEVILRWHNTPPNGSNREKVLAVKNDEQVVKFMQWLEEADEESDSDS